MPIMNRRNLLAMGATAALGMAVGVVGQARAGVPLLRVYKTPWCGCCGAWVAHMHGAGFRAQVSDLEDLDPVKNRYGVPPHLRSCHTALVDGYVVEGHVPAADVARLLAERPTAIGLSVPGMPIGSPGMEQGARKDPYVVVLFGGPEERVFARH